MLSLRGRRAAGALCAAGAAAALIDDVQNGPRLVRRLLRRRRSTVNVVASHGEPGAPRTLTVLAHHDAHQAGRFYDQALQRKLHRLAPALIARIKTSPPQWWIGLAGPSITVTGSAVRRRGELIHVTLIGRVKRLGRFTRGEPVQHLSRTREGVIGLACGHCLE